MNFTNDSKGINCAKGYGKSYFILKNHVRPRCTFTHCDSFGCNDTDFGTFMNCSHVLNKFNDAELKATLKAADGS